MQDDKYNFNTSEIEAAIVDEDKISIPEYTSPIVTPEYQPFDLFPDTGIKWFKTDVPPELIDKEEFSVMAYDMYRFLAWLFPRQYGVKQIE